MRKNRLFVLFLTLCMACTLLAPAAAAAKFTDVQPGAYYADAVDWAVAKEITNGKTATTFAPKDPCTRAEMAAFLFRLSG